MTWKYPALLWLLLAAGGLLALYVATLRRVPRRGALALPTWTIAEAAAAHAGRLRRHLSAAIFLLAIVAALLGAAGPVVPWPTPTGRPVVLIIDVSRSMEENDIRPSRIEASKTAALEFASRLPRESQAGLVSFGNYATLVVPLTADRERLRAGIESLTTQLRTQLGTGLLEGVRAVTGESSGAPAPPPGNQPVAFAILLSDGRVSDGVPPLEAAQEARRRGVRVYTVGVGTFADPRTFRSGYFGVLDEPTLREVASETGGEYFRAAETRQLRRIYRDLARRVGWERRPTDAAPFAAAVALGLLVASVALRAWVSPIH